VIVSFQLCDQADGVVYYFATERTRSEAGARLAERLAEVVAARVEGRATAILKETRAPAVVVAHRALDEKLGRRVVEGLEVFFKTAGD
jgi:hypothetical protein